MPQFAEKLAHHHVLAQPPRAGERGAQQPHPLDCQTVLHDVACQPAFDGHQLPLVPQSLELDGEPAIAIDLVREIQDPVLLHSFHRGDPSPVLKASDSEGRSKGVDAGVFGAVVFGIESVREPPNVGVSNPQAALVRLWRIRVDAREEGGKRVLGPRDSDVAAELAKFSIVVVQQVPRDAVIEIGGQAKEFQIRNLCVANESDRKQKYQTHDCHACGDQPA